ncbi:DUF6919 domain-containing protein [Streptomyces tsukubensis]|uniref:DUF6919 domain-containing protein n=1 Tax=Streptomyces tsukubensis TaxID=83656 RepID=UPI00344F8ACA
MKIRLPLLDRLLSRRLDRRWKTAETLSDLGDLMAEWLEGTISSWPGYARGYGPEEETRDLIPALAAACRAGYVTTCSQPGQDRVTGMDGLPWEQRAAVEGFVRDRDLLRALVDAAEKAGLEIEITDRFDTGERGIPASLHDGRPYTVYGGYLDDLNLRHTTWPGIGPGALDDVFRSVQLTIVAPEYGAAAGVRLWEVLDSVTGRVPAAAPDPR